MALLQAMLMIVCETLGLILLLLLAVLVVWGLELAVKRAHAWIVRMTGGAAL